MRNTNKQIVQIILIICTAAVVSVAGATLTVTKTVDTKDGVCNADCSLREAIAAANSGDTIVFASPLFDTKQTITLSDAVNLRELIINKNLTITGRGATLTIIRRADSAAAQFRVFTISGNRTVNLNGITVMGGSSSGNEDGGGIFNDDATLTLNNSHVTGNTTNGFGGGVYNQGGTLNLLNTTVSNNVCNINNGGGSGGGIHSVGTLNLTNSSISGNVKNNGIHGGGGVWTNGATNINNVTIMDNFAPLNSDSASGIFQSGGVVTVRNAFIAENQNQFSVPPIAGAFVSNGNNIIGYPGTATGFADGVNGDQVGTQPNAAYGRLTPLGHYGGLNYTHGPTLGSSVRDNGNNCVVNLSCPANNPPVALTTDQRGVSRVGNVDIGAFELDSNNTVPVAMTPGRVGVIYNEIITADNRGNFYNNSAGSVPGGLTFNGAGLRSNLFDAADTKPLDLLAPADVISISGVPTNAGTSTFGITMGTMFSSVRYYYKITILPAIPTAATISISGRVIAPQGSGLKNARVTLTDSQGNARTILTGKFGSFRLNDVAAGETYIISIASRHYIFQTQVVTANEEITELDFLGLSQTGEDILDNP